MTFADPNEGLNFRREAISSWDSKVDATTYKRGAKMGTAKMGTWGRNSRPRVDVALSQPEAHTSALGVS